ncbi:MAG: GGDEF domain-containing protein [Bradyrhizobiaceae bacterium]|nr:GGDEF domain-containing protein [Bradyrhizobiaceae bacterium]
MKGDTRRKPAEAAISPAGAGAGAPAPAKQRWPGWQLGRKSAQRNLSSLWRVASLPTDLFSSRDHDVLLVHYRMRFLSARLGAVLIFLSFATVAWIVIDIALFNANWDVVLPLAAGRIVTAAAFLAIASAQAWGASRYQPIAALALTVITGIAFFFFAHAVISHGGEYLIGSPGHAQYMLLPIALAVGLSIFPLTLVEATVLALLPLLAFLLETLLLDGGQVWLYRDIAALLICLIMLTTASSAMSQLVLLKGLFGKSTFDPLTRAISRLAGTELLTILFEHARRAGAPLSLLLIDLDRFKAVNDGHGHEAGDQLLREVVEAIQRRLRRQDAVIRWGGEELVIVLPFTNAAQAVQVAAAICRHGLALRPDGVPQTASIGLAERIGDQAAHWRDLVEAADVRMYMAKELGRSRLQGPDMSLELSARAPAALDQSAAPFSILEGVAPGIVPSER